MSNFFCISGPSGVGKTSLTDYLKKKHSIGHPLSYTTRPPREGEKDGTDYFFTDHNRFEQMIMRGEFGAWDEVYGQLYGTRKQDIIEKTRAYGKAFVIFNPGGARQLQDAGHPAKYIYIHPPNMKILEERLMARGANNLSQRVAIAQSEIDSCSWFDVHLVNDDFFTCVKKLEEEMGLHNAREK